jgi:hypothetical protein
LKATKVVTFNAAAELSLGSASLIVGSSAAGFAPVETKFDVDTQRASLLFAEELPAGSKAILRIIFEAALTDSMTGYYKSTWERGIYALTQFEVRKWPVHTCARWPSLLCFNVEIASESKILDRGLILCHTNEVVV